MGKKLLAEGDGRVMSPLVDVIIPVHSRDRPLERAVESVLAQRTDRRVRVTVVCHGLRAEAFDGIRTRFSDDVLTFLEFDDGVPSPAGPMNYGIRKTSARYVSRLDSDDWLQPGTLDRWLDLAGRGRPSAIMASLAFEGQRPQMNPLVRPMRSRRLDPVKDRLSGRTAPLGLIERATIERLGLTFTEGLATGEDIEFGLKLWFLGHRTDVARGAPGYIIGTDAVTRVTSTMLRLEDELRPIQLLLERDWLASLAPESRAAIAVKIVRNHLIHAIGRRPDVAQWGPDGATLVRRLITDVVDLAPDALIPLDRADRLIVDSIMDESSDAEIVTRAHARWKTAKLSQRMLTRSVRGVFAPESTLRRYVRYRINW